VESLDTRYVPDQWTGGAADRRAMGHQPPIVYAPTDTTQFGFYGKHAPSWQPMPRTNWSTGIGVVVQSSPAATPRPVSQPNNSGVNVPVPPK
jgi:hypothetical protein